MKKFTITYYNGKDLKKRGVIVRAKTAREAYDSFKKKHPSWKYIDIVLI